MINTSFRLAPWADVLYACDATWWDMHFSEVAKGFKGAELWTIDSRSRDRYGLHWIYGYDHGGLSRTTAHIHTGQNSGYQAISLAHYFGATRILLLGFDFQRSNGKTHWHGDHPRGLGNGGRYSAWIKDMNLLASDAKKLGLEIINCSPKTALHCFHRSTIQKALCTSVDSASSCAASSSLAFG